MAALENGKHCLTFSSGLGATVAITALLQAGDHLIAADDLYGGTNRYFQKGLSKQNIKVTFMDMTKNVQNVIDAIEPNTKMVWLESPSNPLLKIIDLRAVIDGVKSRRSDIIVVVDNTFLTCYFQVRSRIS